MTIRTQHIYTLLPILVGVCASLVGIFVWEHSVTADTKVHTLAERAVETCVKEGDKDTCYENTIASFYPAQSLTDVFSVIREVRTMDSGYQFCHVLAHKLGEAVVAEDPAKWLDAIPRNPTDGLCSNGFIHGVIVGMFRSAILDDATLHRLVPQFSVACEPRDSWQPTLLDEAMCYHALGHLYDFVTNAALPKALDLCEKTTGNKGTGDYRQRCYEGVFMQIYQPLEDEDYALINRLPIKPTAQNVRHFCTSFGNPQYVGACLRESWPLFKDDILSGTGVERFCSGQPGKDQEDLCYLSSFFLLGRMSLNNLDTVGKKCGSVSDTRQTECFISVARAVMEEDRTDGSKAIGVCTNAPPQASYQCISNLVDTASSVLGYNTPAYKTFCALVPKPFDTGCLGTSL